jgi:hypothetical protein
MIVPVPSQIRHPCRGVLSQVLLLRLTRIEAFGAADYSVSIILGESEGNALSNGRGVLGIDEVGRRTDYFADGDITIDLLFSDLLRMS